MSITVQPMTVDGTIQFAVVRNGEIVGIYPRVWAAKVAAYRMGV